MKKEYINLDILLPSIDLYEIDWLDTFPEENEIHHEFSDTFKIKMEKLIRSIKKPYYIFINTIGKRVAVIILLIIISFSAITLNVKALRDPIINFVIDVYEKFSIMFFDIEDTTSLPKEILVKYEPSVIPEGYTIAEKVDKSNSHYLVYKNGTGNIAFRQALMNETQLDLDTEGTDIQHIFINEYIGVYYSNKGYQFIIWNNEEYSFILYGNISKEELIVIAKSIQ